MVVKATSTLDRLLVALGVCLAAATVGVVTFAGPSDTTAAGSGSSKPTATNRIVISDYKFMPNPVEVKAGAKVTIVNNDASPHTATATGDKVFDTGILRKGDEKVIALTKTGTVSYICQLHPFMKATIKVVG